MELRDTINWMTSDDYKNRMKAEYHQLMIRIRGLTIVLDKLHSNQLDFIPASSATLLSSQLQVMRSYALHLEERALAEGITL